MPHFIMEHRSDADPCVYGGETWLYPGGKVEPQETPQQALIRELREELGISPTMFTRLTVEEAGGKVIYSRTNRELIPYLILEYKSIDGETRGPGALPIKILDTQRDIIWWPVTRGMESVVNVTSQMATAAYRFMLNHWYGSDGAPYKRAL